MRIAAAWLVCLAWLAGAGAAEIAERALKVPVKFDHISRGLPVWKPIVERFLQSHAPTATRRNP